MGRMMASTPRGSPTGKPGSASTLPKAPTLSTKTDSRPSNQAHSKTPKPGFASWTKRIPCPPPTDTPSRSRPTKNSSLSNGSNKAQNTKPSGPSSQQKNKLLHPQKSPPGPSPASTISPSPKWRTLENHQNKKPINAPSFGASLSTSPASRLLLMRSANSSPTPRPTPTPNSSTAS